MNEVQKLFIAAICACALAETRSAPRRSASTTFDQKQTGEYNIQLHLKDFQIIAVVGDDSFGGLGDYDYNYDYSDFTVKPSTSSSTTTKKPSTSDSTQNGDLSSVDFSILDLTSKPTTKKPAGTHPYPIISPSTTLKPLLTTPTTTTTTKKTVADDTSTHTLVSKLPLPSVNGNTPPTMVEHEVVSENIEKVSTAAPSTVKIITSPPITTTTAALTTIKKVSVTTTRATTVKPIVSIPGQIPVVVQDFSIVRNETPIVKDKNPESTNIKDKKGDVVTSVTIVPLEDANDGNLGEVAVNEQPTLGEILHYRRCAQGYQRDKRGRCRKVRRPQISMGLTRFASNFASRFRQAGNPSSDELRDDTAV
ncbi:mucin-2-like [Atheta coriaria]|uniref:mucin-2-like n=1 Tax=Dalotia coriaria TaxID=877792 RepID=UPI0031F3F880